MDRPPLAVDQAASGSDAAPRRPAALWRLVAVGAVCALGAVSAEAHEAGTTKVVASFAADGAYRFDLTTDAGVLLSRLELGRGEPRSGPSSAADLQRGFDRLCRDIVGHATIRFDGVPVVPETVCAVDVTDPSRPEDVRLLGVTVTFGGKISGTARVFQWTYDLTFTPYELSVRTGADRATEAVWLEGGEPSPPTDVFRLEAPKVRWVLARHAAREAFTRVLPHGLAQIFVLLGLCALAGGVRQAVPWIGSYALGHGLALALTSYGVGVPLAVADLGGANVAGLAAVGVLSTRVGRLARRQRHGADGAGTGRLAWRGLIAVSSGICGFVFGVELGALLPLADVPAAGRVWMVGGWCAGAAAAQASVAALGLVLSGGRPLRG
jgi:hypothetical protein